MCNMELQSESSFFCKSYTWNQIAPPEMCTHFCRRAASLPRAKVSMPVLRRSRVYRAFQCNVMTYAKLLLDKRMIVNWSIFYPSQPLGIILGLKRMIIVEIIHLFQRINNNNMKKKLIVLVQMPVLQFRYGTAKALRSTVILDEKLLWSFVQYVLLDLVWFLAKSSASIIYVISRSWKWRGGRGRQSDVPTYHCAQCSYGPMCPRTQNDTPTDRSVVNVLVCPPT